MKWFKKQKSTRPPYRDTLNVNVYDVEDNDGVDKHYCSFFESNFVPNSVFKKTIFNFIKTEMNKDLGVVQAAISQKNGYVYIIDQRTPTPEGRVLPSDIMGAFEVENETLKNFNENSSYQIRTENGFCDFGKKMKKQTSRAAFFERFKSLV